MADETTTETVTTEQPIKSTTDLALEKLTARLDALETENKELRSANQGLWAQLHPIQEQPLQNVQDNTASQPQEDQAYELLKKKLGIEE